MDAFAEFTSGASAQSYFGVHVEITCESRLNHMAFKIWSFKPAWLEK